MTETAPSLGELWGTYERAGPHAFRVRLSDHSYELFIEAAIGDSGFPVITTLTVVGDPVTAAHLRSIPLGRIHAFLATPEAREWIGDPRSSKIDLGVDPAASLYRRYDPVARLRRPDGKNPEEFYRRVAVIYRQLVATSSRPAVLMSEEADVPVSTARRWIATARELGLLEKGQRGRAI